MFRFWKRQAKNEGVAFLSQQVEKIAEQLRVTQSELRTLEAEQIALHDQVRKWMRRAVAAERNQERGAHDGAPVTPAPAAALPWGAAGRILQRARRERTGQLNLDEGASNGVHS